jgi:hypothetical protein
MATSSTETGRTSRSSWRRVAFKPFKLELRHIIHQTGHLLMIDNRQVTLLTSYETGKRQQNYCPLLDRKFGSPIRIKCSQHWIRRMFHTSPVSARPPLWKVWWVACRPHTLTAALSPVLVAYNAGLSVIEDVDKGSYLWLTLQWAAFCMLVQVGSSTEKSRCRRLLKILTCSPFCAAWNKLAQRLCRLCESKF